MDRFLELGADPCEDEILSQSLLAHQEITQKVVSSLPVSEIEKGNSLLILAVKQTNPVALQILLDKGFRVGGNRLGIAMFGNQYPTQEGDRLAGYDPGLAERVKHILCEYSEYKDHVERVR